MTYEILKIPDLKKALERFLENNEKWELVPVVFEDYYFNNLSKRVQYRNKKLHLRRKGRFGRLFYSIYVSPDMSSVWLGNADQSFRTMNFVNDKLMEG